MADYDLIVIGAGPAGYVGAIRAAQLGKSVVVVDFDRGGGTCNNHGCIPTKALLKSAELYQDIRNRSAEFGFKVTGLEYDWTTILKRARSVSEKGSAGLDYLFKKNKITFLRGTARMEKAGEVIVKIAEGKEEKLAAPKILVATGCVSRPLPDLPFNGKTVISSKEALQLPVQPKAAVIIGAGAIGVEFAYFWNAFGTKVTLIEMLPHILPIEDTEVSQALEKSLAKQGITILTGHKTTKTRADASGVKITVTNAKGTEKQVEADLALVAVGVTPVLPGGSWKPALTERGYLQTNDRYETSIPGIYAAGDVIGPPWLAHVASFESVQAVEGMFVPGHAPRKATLVPGCTYCHPQVASIGLTERAAREKGLQFKVGKFPFMASGKARAIGETEGFVKLLTGDPHGEILGAHIIGPDATEMLAAIGIAMNAELTLDEIHATLFAHPTLSESLHEAALAAAGHSLHT